MNIAHDVKTLIRFIVAANGNLPLAAERAGIAKEDLVTIICGDGGAVSLSESLRAQLILSTFDTLMQTRIAFLASLDYMSADGISKAYAAQLQAFTMLSATATPDLVGENNDAAIAKQRMITRLDQHIRTDKKLLEKDKDSESEETAS